MRRRKGFKRRFTRTRRRTTGLARKVSYLLKQNRQNRPALDWDDTEADRANIFTTPTIVKIDAPASSQRCLIKSVQLKGYLELQGALAAVQHARIVIFTDKANEGAALPAWSDVYSTTAGATGYDAVMALRNIAVSKNEGQRFKIIYDKVFTMIRDTTTSGGIKDNIMFKFYKKLNIPTILGSGGTYWEKGGLYLAFVATSATADMDFTYAIRVRAMEKST